MRDLSPMGRQMDATATVSVEEAADPQATWIEEAISFSLGGGPIARRAERWLLNPVFGIVVRWKTTRAFRRLADLLAQGHEEGEVAVTEVSRTGSDPS